MRTLSPGFSLLELSVVIALIIFLSLLALPGFSRIFAKARRAEAYIQLRSLYIAQKAYFAEHGTYAQDLIALGWKPEGSVYYTYGIGKTSKNKHYIVGSLATPASALPQVYASSQNFLAAAAGDIDGDNYADILTVDAQGTITIMQDDLA